MHKTKKEPCIIYMIECAVGLPPPFRSKCCCTNPGRGYCLFVCLFSELSAPVSTESRRRRAPVTCDWDGPQSWRPMRRSLFRMMLGYARNTHARRPDSDGPHTTNSDNLAPPKHVNTALSPPTTVRMRRLASSAAPLQRALARRLAVTPIPTTAPRNGLPAAPRRPLSASSNPNPNPTSSSSSSSSGGGAAASEGGAASGAGAGGPRPVPPPPKGPKVVRECGLCVPVCVRLVYARATSTRLIDQRVQLCIQAAIIRAPLGRSHLYPKHNTPRFPTITRNSP